MKSYDYKKIDAFWQKKWSEEKLYQAPQLPGAKKVYVLDMFPYPSGEGLHVGHPKGYIATDIYSRFKRMNGYDVLHPMGWDAFGLPAEQFALKNKTHPKLAVEKNIANFKSQLSHLGFDYDWSREINTTDPKFYKWTQWIFTKLYEKGLAYESFEPINWCPSCKTGLANEDVNGNTCERCDSVVEKKPLRQWVLKITDYADRMIKDLDLLQWPEGIKTAQRNWIGRNEGAEFNFKLAISPQEYFKFENKFIEDVLSGKKTMTIRLDSKNLAQGHFFSIKDGEGNDKGVAVVQNVIKKTFSELALDNSHGTSYLSKDEQLEAYKKYYGNEVTSDTIFYEINFCMVDTSVRVFTTRPDTLCGVTFVAISAKLASSWFGKGMLFGEDIREYIKATLDDQNKKQEYGVTPGKTGIFSGVYAINPATKEKIPVWIADYVLNDVGTGALMAVPAHDERDYDFAKKYGLPIVETIRPYVIDHVNVPRPDKATKVRRNVHAIVYDPKIKKYLILRNSIHSWDTVVIGGVEEGEDLITAAKREVLEETGYTDLVFKRILGSPVQAGYFAAHKDENRIAIASAVYFELASDKKQDVATDGENEGNEIMWIDAREFVPGKMINSELSFWLSRIEDERNDIYIGEGVVVNSKEHDGITSTEAKQLFVHRYGGKHVVTYKLQDWTFARQRYWGEPFPVVRDENGRVYMVDESELPVLLPEVESYEPTGTGESPLASISEWVNVTGYITPRGTFKTSSDGVRFTRETNTMPQWAGSSWYYLRFADPDNNTALIDPEIEKKWSPVDVYVGGDHATRHLIYARFWHKFLYDIGVVSHPEPFSRLEFLGFILAEDGRKMSKRWGNVIDPDDVVDEYGADTLRVYEMFMAPFEQTASWSTTSIKGADKFLDRVYGLQKGISVTSSVENEVHKTIKKVTEDIEGFKFNTAVSQMMILVNAMEKGRYTKEDYLLLLTILAPFAPHITEQLWLEMGNTTSIHKVSWPAYDPHKTINTVVTYAFQINGKLRATIDFARDSEENEVISGIKSHEIYLKYVGDMEPKKVIFVQNRLVNIVI